MIRRLVWMFVMLASPCFAQHTYYVSTSTGSDSNTATQAQSKSTPWAHLKGMAGCTSNCSSYSPVAGDQFILMGCDVWEHSDLPINWDWSGTSANPIKVGVDTTWYNTSNCPSSWNRPIWDAGKVSTCWSGSANVMLTVAGVASSVSYVTFDNIEMRGMEITAVSSCAGGQGYGDFVDFFNPVTNVTFSNVYIHGWQSTVDNCIIFQGQAGNLFTSSIIDGSDGTGVAATKSCYGFYPTPPSIQNTVIHDLPNPIVGYAQTGAGGPASLVWSGNNIYNVNDSYAGANHGNAIEIVGSGTYYIYNNLIHHMVCSGCESMMIGNSGETSYVFNNIIWDLGPIGSSAQTPSIPQGSASGLTEIFRNNTIVASDNQSCINNSGQGATNYTITAQNTHCIQGTSGGAVTDYTAVGQNLLQTTAQADANSSPHFDQYAASQAYVYSPLASTNSTVGAGSNLTSNCTGPTAALCQATTYGCTEQSVGGVVQSVCTTHTTNARPSSGAWDLGAYQFSSSTAQTPQPPTGLQATVQ